MLSFSSGTLSYPLLLNEYSEHMIFMILDFKPLFFGNFISIFWKITKNWDSNKNIKCNWNKDTKIRSGFQVLQVHLSLMSFMIPSKLFSVTWFCLAIYLLFPPLFHLTFQSEWNQLTCCNENLCKRSYGRSLKVYNYDYIQAVFPGGPRLFCI